MTADLATSALQMTLDKYQKPLIVHSDMGHNTRVLSLLWFETFTFTQKTSHTIMAVWMSFHLIFNREEIYSKVHKTVTEVQETLG
ncbi:hypothetical protein QMA56_03310 [Leuconostoc falkenbergense]|uniref:hypothetical protein n=1 Tax=Leuconostoc falkenbergense TaxID=2766470 RepID=UPI0024AE4649|nr:hypothetical protein [Leuconostoc falkenbergense]MDI6666735.1 hypothetical protein [Leuconostoc falkenbergense]